MLKMSAGLSVGRQDGPAISELAYPSGTHIDHGLNGHDHSICKFLSPSAFTVVRHLRRFVQFTTQPVANEFPDHSVSVILTILLNGISHISDPVAQAELANPDIQGFFRDTQQFFGFRRNLTNFKGIGMVPVESIF